MNLYFKKICTFKNINLPKSKSITNRIIFLSFLCNKELSIKNPLISDDTNIMINNLNNINNLNIIKINNKIIIKRCNKKISNFFFFKNAGTVARTLFCYLILKGGKFLLDGNENMRKRPFKGILNIFNKIFNINYKIKYLIKKFHLPLIIKKGNIKPLKNYLFMEENFSSQYLSGFLMCINNFLKKLFIHIKNIVSIKYLMLTINILKKFNVKIIYYKKNIIYFDSKYFFNKKLRIPYDIISCSYYFLFSYKKIKLFKNKKFEQNESNIINVFQKLGFFFYINNGNLKVFRLYKNIYSVKINCYHIIDSSMIILMLINYGITKIKLFNIYNWKYKECNRIKAMTKELKKIGCKVNNGKNWINIKKVKSRENVIINTYDDHRIAMCFYCYLFKIKSFLLKPNCVKKTFPNFFKYA
ncbi:hypothetical protein [Candidatus Vidania fulgoroideorum]